MLKKVLIVCAASIMLSASGTAAGSVSPDEAIKMLKEGNERFVSGKSIRPNSDATRLQETSKGQHPFVTINSCSDSRVPPELLFDSGFGDLFIVRNAGNVSSTDEIGTIEYGTEHLGTRLVVVMGHTKCGAVTAVAKGEHVGGSIPKLVAPIVPAVTRVKAAHAGHNADEWINKAIVENVWEQVANILKKSPIVREMVLEGKVKIVGALYNVETGKVEFLGEHPKQLKVLVDIHAQEKIEKQQKKQQAAAKEEQLKQPKMPSKYDLLNKH